MFRVKLTTMALICSTTDMTYFMTLIVQWDICGRVLLLHLKKKSFTLKCGNLFIRQNKAIRSAAFAFCVFKIKVTSYVTMLIFFLYLKKIIRPIVWKYLTFKRHTYRTYLGPVTNPSVSPVNILGLHLLIINFVN